MQVMPWDKDLWNPAGLRLVAPSSLWKKKEHVVH
jgi:hypothetical protein